MFIKDKLESKFSWVLFFTRFYACLLSLYILGYSVVLLHVMYNFI